MKKIVIERPGGFRRLQVRECENPTPGDNEVLVEMNAQLKGRVDEIDRAAVDQWWDRINGWKSIDSLAYDHSSTVISPYR